MMVTFVFLRAFSILIPVSCCVQTVWYGYGLLYRIRLRRQCVFWMWTAWSDVLLCGSVVNPHHHFHDCIDQESRLLQGTFTYNAFYLQFCVKMTRAYLLTLFTFPWWLTQIYENMLSYTPGIWCLLLFHLSTATWSCNISQHELCNCFFLQIICPHLLLCCIFSSCILAQLMILMKSIIWHYIGHNLSFYFSMLRVPLSCYM